jgi:peroxiredoxin
MNARAAAVDSRFRARLTMPRQPLAMLLAMLSACVGLGVLAAQAPADEGASASTRTLLAADYSPRPLFALPSLDGPPQELARLRGRVVLVHFFATWCEPCRPEMARLRQMQSRLGDQPLAIIPISVAEADGAVRRFFAGEPLPFPILLDRDRSTARAWDIQALPSTIVLDRHLQARFVAQGDLDWLRPDVMHKVTDLLAEPSG